jgi:hypothetical protein
MARIEASRHDLFFVEDSDFIFDFAVRTRARTMYDLRGCVFSFRVFSKIKKNLLYQYSTGTDPEMVLNLETGNVSLVIPRDKINQFIFKSGSYSISVRMGDTMRGLLYGNLTHRVV